MSRTIKDMPWAVQNADLSRPGSQDHCHNIWQDGQCYTAECDYDPRNWRQVFLGRFDKFGHYPCHRHLVSRPSRESKAYRKLYERRERRRTTQMLHHGLGDEAAYMMASHRRAY